MAPVIALAVLVPVSLALAPHLRMVKLGDDLARNLDLEVELARALLLLVGVVLAAVATAVAGPIGFIALVAPRHGGRRER
ncbi:MAG TPA: iron chelate uptake ABC transporter family permease subunit [Acidimicrobiales bacterium]|nr:iron chelate uptake ABC transporter family permease subunit [Acidimicrobiales bacterium]